jgi:hypothetical protein
LPPSFLICRRSTGDRPHRRASCARLGPSDAPAAKSDRPLPSARPRRGR